MDHLLDLQCHPIQYICSPFEVEGEGEGELMGEVMVEMVGEVMVEMVRSIVAFGNCKSNCRCHGQQHLAILSPIVAVMDNDI